MRAQALKEQHVFEIKAALLKGPKTWSELLGKVGLGRKSLSAHLKELVASEEIERRVDASTYPPHVIYFMSRQERMKTRKRTSEYEDVIKELDDNEIAMLLSFARFAKAVEEVEPLRSVEELEDMASRTEKQYWDLSVNAVNTLKHIEAKQAVLRYTHAVNERRQQLMMDLVRKYTGYFTQRWQRSFDVGLGKADGELVKWAEERAILTREQVNRLRELTKGG